MDSIFADLGVVILRVAYLLFGFALGVMFSMAWLTRKQYKARKAQNKDWARLLKAIEDGMMQADRPVIH